MTTPQLPRSRFAHIIDPLCGDYDPRQVEEMLFVMETALGISLSALSKTEWDRAVARAKEAIDLGMCDGN